MALRATATWRGGYEAAVAVRGHALTIDEPEDSGGHDAGMMPTEALCAALASCFCLAVGFAARKRDQEVPGLTVTVTAERAGDELRYEHFVVTTQAELGDEELARLVKRARPLCWVSNSLAAGVTVEYLHTTTVNDHFRK